MKREWIKTLLKDFVLWAGITIGYLAICYPTLWLMKRYLPPHMWEAFVDAFNRFFGG